MQPDLSFNSMLRGRKFRRLLELSFMKLREKHGLRQIEIEIMMYLSERPMDSASDIYRNLYMNKGHVSQAMTRLCTDGFLSARVDSADRRYLNYKITKKGRRLIEEISEVIDTLQKKLFEGISEEAWEMILKYTKAISDNIDRMGIE